MRIDHRISDNDSIFGSISWIGGRTSSKSPPLPGELDAGGFLGEQEAEPQGRNVMMSYTKIWNQTLITETRAALTPV